MKQTVTYTESEYATFLSAVATGTPIFPAGWSRKKRNAMYARRHREMREGLN